MNPLSLNARITKDPELAVVNGTGKLDSTVFTSMPGSKNVEFLLRSPSINYRVVQYIDPVKYKNQTISIDFRYCRPGEYQIGDI
jgi:hypothetical protein